MLPKYEDVRYELLRPGQVKALRRAAAIAYVPAGSLEWHGFQNPLGTDALKAHAICCEAAMRHGGVVLPPFYQGLLGRDNWGPPGWQGFTLSFNEASMFEAAMLGIARALIFGGWKVIVGVTGHDVAEQRDGMQRAIDAAVAEAPEKNATGFAVMEGQLHSPDDDLPLSMDHAGAWETSCMMYAHAEKVDLNTLRKRKLSDEENLKMSGPEGIGGKNPLKYASAELGRRIIERMGRLIGAKARQMLEQAG